MKGCISVNIVNELRKIRKGVVYSSITSVVDELIQNSQRAGATKVDIDIVGNEYRQKDNGTGLSDPNMLFEKSSSGWVSIADTKTPFGEGFFSTFAIADVITARSKNWVAVVDVNKAIKDGKLDFPIEETVNETVGFSVRLEGELIRENADKLMIHVKELCSIVPMEVTLNGEVIEHVELLKAPVTKVSIDVDNDKCKGYVSATNTYGQVKLYYEYRYVDYMYVEGIEGVLQLEDEALNLKAPDRKGFAYDDKYTDFSDMLKEVRKEVYMKLVEVADDDTIDAYAKDISEVLDVSDYIEYLDLSKVEDYKVYEKAEQEEARQETERPTETVSYSDTARNEEPVTKVTELRKANHELKKAEKSSRTLGTLDSVVGKCYILAEEIEEYKDLMDMLAYYGVKVLIAKNKLYELSYEWLGIPHIASEDNRIEKVNKIERVGEQTKKEKRVMFMLSKIEESLGLGKVFRIADLSLTVKKFYGGKEVSDTPMKVGGLCKDGKIYLDRDTLELPKYRVDKADNIYVTLNDYRFLLKHLTLIAHELAHLVYKTEDNTVEHFKAQDKLCTEIAKVFE